MCNLSDLIPFQSCFSVYANSVIEGLCPGIVSSVGESAQLICWSGGCYTLVGNIQTLQKSDWCSLGELLFRKMQHQADQLGLFINSVDESELKEICQHMGGHAMIDRCFTYWNHNFPTDELPIDELSIDEFPNSARNIRAHIRDLTLDDLQESSLHNAVLAKWGSADHFFASGFGVVAETNDKRLQAHCISGAIGGGKVELSMKVLPPFQSKGLGDQMGRAFLQRTKRRNLKPVWTCMESNIASVKLAEKLGFQNLKTDLFLYWLK